jgi:hypothetical protein
MPNEEKKEEEEEECPRRRSFLLGKRMPYVLLQGEQLQDISVARMGYSSPRRRRLPSMKKEGKEIMPKEEEKKKLTI